MSTKRKWNNTRETANGDQPDTTRPPKRKRNVVFEAPTSEEVHSARQLRHLLTFSQDLQQARHGLQSFKEVLDGILNETGAASDDKLRLVADYLDMVKPREVEDEEPVYLLDIMETWSMAAQMGNDNVMSAVVVVLSLLLKVLSNHVDMVPTALAISRTILQKRQQELLAKNLSADKGKDFIVSPTLRLVREIACLDGGALAVWVFRARSNTLKSLARNLDLRYLGEGLEDPKRPSVRTNATRLFLSILKFVHAEAKRDLLLQKDMVAALMRGLKEDPPYLIFEILDTLKTSVVLDQKLKDAKIRILNAQSLIRITSLYTYQHDKPGEGARSVAEAAHEFLMVACTNPSAGIIRSHRGYYPEGIDADRVPRPDADDVEDGGLDSIPWMGQFSQSVPVRNTLLAEFIQTLRPWSSTKHNELLVAILAACPELTANYYANKRSFGFDPKLSATWIGYATLLLNTIRLDIPDFFGWHKKSAKAPPPMPVVLGNILPLPLELKAIQKCIDVNTKSKLISFFAVRILVLALEKLSTALDMYREASTLSGTLWQDAAHRLIDEFCQKVPSMKDIILAYRAIPDDDLLQRVTASRLLLLYHEVIPQAALAAKFDYAPILSTAIKRLDTASDGAEDKAMRLMELENLFAMAKYSPSIKWFARGKDYPSSPFITIMKLCVENAQGLSAGNLKKVLDFVAEEQEVVARGSQSSSLEPLLASLESLDAIDPAVWNFLDNCAERCARTPIKYQEMACELIVEQSKTAANFKALDEASLSPLMMSITEQLPFVVASTTSKTALKGLANFLSEYLGRSKAAGVAGSLLEVVLDKIKLAFGDSKARKHLSIPERAPLPQEMDVDGDARLEHTTTPSGGDKQPEVTTPEQLEEALAVPIKADKDNSALMKWAARTAEELVEDGYAASVIWLLASEHPSIRREAHTAIAKMAAKIRESGYEEKAQVELLLAELHLSTGARVGEAAVPSPLLAFACRGLDVLKDPTHDLYPKLNKFLLRGPRWALDKLPLVRDVLKEPPTDGGRYYAEVSWLLAYLLDGLRAPADVVLFLKRDVFQAVFELWANPNMGRGLRTQMLRIVYRTTCLEGGSEVLVTRFGCADWLRALQAGAAAGGGEMGGLVTALLQRLWDTCGDKGRIDKWLGRSV